MLISPNLANFSSQNKNNVAFGVKIPRLYVLEVAVGRHLSQDNSGSLYDTLEILSGQMNLADEHIGKVPNIHKQCVNMLVEKFPVFNKIIQDSKDFFSVKKKTNDEIIKWVEKQIQLLGDGALEVPTLKEYGLEKSLANKSISSKELKKYRDLGFKNLSLYNFLKN